MFCGPRASIPVTLFTEKNIADFSKTVLDQSDIADGHIQALVLVPTRDVAVQVVHSYP